MSLSIAIRVPGARLIANSSFSPETERSLRLVRSWFAKRGSLSHRFVVAGERSRLENDDTAEATRALREMLSAGKLSKLIPVKENGRMETKQVEQDEVDDRCLPGGFSCGFHDASRSDCLPVLANHSAPGNGV